MDWLFYILVFIISCGLLYLSGEWVIAGLMRVARLLGWREFVVAFFIMAAGASLPNLFVGITSAIRGIPHLSLGDIVGNNLVTLTVAVAIGILFSATKEILITSRTAQTTALYTAGAAILPLLLISDGTLSRSDGLILIGFFGFYLIWLFSKKERFTNQEYEVRDFASLTQDVKGLFKDLFKIIAGIVFLLVAAQGIVQTATFFAKELDASLILVGILIVGFGNALPEIYFAIVAAKQKDNWLVLGNLMGAVIIPATLVLGIVSIIHPIYIADGHYSWGGLVLSRIFVILASLLFLIFARTNRKITTREAYILLAVYTAFLVSIIWFVNF